MAACDRDRGSASADHRHGMLVTDIPDAATDDGTAAPVRSVDHCLPAGTDCALLERQSRGSELSAPNDERRAGWR